jgi:hypothetical protein
MGLNIPHSHISDSKVCRFIGLGFTPPQTKMYRKVGPVCLLSSMELLNRTLHNVLLIEYHGLLGSTPAPIPQVQDSDLCSAI